ncbi:MAG: RNA polymerase subunit sigma [Desulfobacteraceae bacterium]|nr:RNA polymerase subunit sigma [Desulfobacteraceae bacterium]
MEKQIAHALRKAAARGHITVLTGAGISAESGIPTFRGPEGYWTIGSSQYQPQEMATWKMFSRHPEQVWKWYLYRMDTCRKADPNPGHSALVQMQNLLKGRYILITQNVDGLHLRAGSDPETTYQIHGNIFFTRCVAECRRKIYPLAKELTGKKMDDALSEEETAALRCPDCGGWARPHVLWFDETYNEHYFRFHSAMAAAVKTDLLIVAGTAGATNLPNQVAREVASHGGVIVNIDIEPNVFSKLAMATGRGFFIQQPSASVLPEVVAVFREVLDKKA